jgi:hypothetical protein
MMRRLAAQASRKYCRDRNGTGCAARRSIAENLGGAYSLCVFRSGRGSPADGGVPSIGVHSLPQRAQRTTRPGVTSESGTSYAAAQDGQTMRIQFAHSGVQGDAVMVR